jgi:hypothetical protein
MTGQPYAPPLTRNGPDVPSAGRRTVAVLIAVVIGLLPAVAIIVFAFTLGDRLWAVSTVTPTPMPSTYHAPPAGPVPNPYVSSK